MVTGDNKITAMAIAKECNILTSDTHIDDDSVLEGPEFYERMGGLYCKTCKNDRTASKDKPVCECPSDKVDEGVRNLAAFRSIR